MYWRATKGQSTWGVMGDGRPVEQTIRQSMLWIGFDSLLSNICTVGRQQVARVSAFSAGLVYGSMNLSYLKGRLKKSILVRPHMRDRTAYAAHIRIWPISVPGARFDQLTKLPVWPLMRPHGVPFKTLLDSIP
ncbi:hypothetical protein QJS10_CPB11g00851 [Acorus calamus]|uniref:Uncharacterized protein n=1 Tax=Acorus calamus TaxID=4465 RepID=A0AAV9DU94_ACOCL|nr:hypothetical protein QJS10_CPB11g00851 [Acorus calamus]